MSSKINRRLKNGLPLVFRDQLALGSKKPLIISTKWGPRKDLRRSQMVLWWRERKRSYTKSAERTMQPVWVVMLLMGVESSWRPGKKAQMMPSNVQLVAATGASTGGRWRRMTSATAPQPHLLPNKTNLPMIIMWVGLSILCFYLSLYGFIWWASFS